MNSDVVSFASLAPIFPEMILAVASMALLMLGVTFRKREQSAPFTVSNICHCQVSSPMLPSAAAMPPCAATVCERVGNTLVMQAVLSPASEQPTAALRPAPPAPTTTTSKTWSFIG